MRLSNWINLIRPGSLVEKTGASVWGVTQAGQDVSLPYIQSGWVNVADSQYTSGSPLAISADAKTQITIDGLGAATNRDYANGMHADVWSGNRFRPSAIGETYQVRLTCTVTQTSAGTGHFVEFQADIGTDEAPFVAAAQSVQLNKGQGEATVLSISAPFFCLATFGLNGARLFVTPSVDVTLHGAAIFIQRTFKP